MEINKNKIWMTVFVVLSCAFILIMAFIIRKNSECVANPFIYGAKKMYSLQPTTEIKTHPVCSCELGNINFYFDKDGTYNENPLLKEYKGGVK